MKEKWLIGGVLIAVVLGGLCSACLYTVNPRQYVVVTQFGNPVATRLEPGLYAKWPAPIQSVNRFDRLLQTYSTPLIEYLTGDKKNIILQAYVCWRIKDPLEFFRAVRTKESAEQKLDDQVRSSIGYTLGHYTMANLVSTTSGEVKIAEMEDRMAHEANEKVSQNYGMEVVTVGFSRLALPEDNARSVYRRMQAERATIANQYRAEGQEAAGKIRFEADRQKSDITGEAYKQAQIIKGQGDAEAARIYADAYAQSPEFFEFLRSLDAYKQIFKTNSTMVLSSDADWLKYLNHADVPRGATEAKEK